MTKKNALFDINYLENSAMRLKALKEESYTPFLSLKDGVIADIGCGTGMDVLNLAAITKGNGIKVIGVDFQEEMIAQANSNLKDNADIEYMVGDTENLPFEDNYLSGIRNERLIQHLIKPEKAFSEFYRVLKQGSPIVIVETDWSSLTFYNGTPEITRKIRNYFTNNNVNNSYSAVSLSHLLEINNFKDISLLIFPFVSQRLEEVMAITKLDFVLNQMELQGYLDKKERVSFLKDLEDANNQHYLNCTLNLIIATATK